MIVGFWERWKGRPISLGLFVSLFIAFGLVAASFQAWRQEHAARIIAEQPPKGRNPVVVRQLQQYYADAASYYDEISEAQSDKEYQDAQKALEEWSPKVGQWILLNMGNGAYARMIDTSRAAPLELKNVKPNRARQVCRSRVAPRRPPSLGTVRISRYVLGRSQAELRDLGVGVQRLEVDLHWSADSDLFERCIRHICKDPEPRLLH